MSWCNTTGFSSMQTTGSSSASGFSYNLRTSSMRRIYSSFSSATHHIFFPPRLQIVTLKQQMDGRPRHVPDQFALHRLLGDQTHRPARPARRRRPADHGDNALAVLGVQQRLLARSRRIVNGPMQSALQVTLADLPGGFG